MTLRTLARLPLSILLVTIFGIAPVTFADTLLIENVTGYRLRQRSRRVVGE